MRKIFRSPLALFLLSAAVVGAGTAIYWQFYTVAPPQYRVQAVEKGDISQTVSANGTINPVTLVSVGTQVSGTVKKLYVDFNSKVKKGEILLELDDATFSAQVEQSQANVQSAIASLELASANEARMRNLFTLEYVSQQDLDTAVQARKVAAAQVLSTRAQLEKDRANFAYSVIRSPVSGVVVDREVDIGQTVAASLQTPTLFKIAQDLSKMQIDANFAEADIGSIRVDQAVRFTVDAFAERHFQGVVKQIRLNPTTVSNVVTYDVVINVDNPEQLLLPGLTAYVNIAVAKRNDVLLVPNAALRFKPTNADNLKRDSVQPGRATNDNTAKPKHDTLSGKVYVLRQGEPTPVSVSIGITDNRNTEIVTGELKADDQVIVGEAQAADKSKSSGGKSPMRMF